MDAPFPRASDFAVDERLGVYTLYLLVPRRQSVFVKLVVESYEGLGITRAIDPHYEKGHELLVLMLVPDAIRDTLAMLEEIAPSAGLRFVLPSEEIRSGFRDELLAELPAGEREDPKDG